MTPSLACAAMIKGFEGLRLAAYRDIGGVWTIGYGHTGPDVTPGLVITQEQAEALFAADLTQAGVETDELLDGAEVTQGQFDALTSFTFNLGGHALMGSTLLEKIWQGDLQGAEDEFLKWDHVGGLVNAGLLRRRTAERWMFLGAAT